jgi:hypothetical protein
MTEPATAGTPERSRSRRPPSVRYTTLWMTLLSIGGALVIWIGLSIQMAAGNDPALGPKAATVTGATHSRPRRIVHTTVLVKRTPAAPAPATGATAVPAPVAPASSSSPPSAPAPVPAPAPAPAPAPVQTTTS